MTPDETAEINPPAEPPKPTTAETIAAYQANAEQAAAESWKAHHLNAGAAQAFAACLALLKQ